MTAPSSPLPTAPLDPALVAGLRAIVGPGHVLVEPALVAGYAVDWTGRWRGDAAAVVRPATAGEVAATVRALAAANVAIVPQGGNTGLVGGGVPRPAADPAVGGRPQVVVSLRRLDRVDEPSVAPGGVPSIRAEAGATLARVRATAAAADLELGVDLAARGAATVGGIVSTNAGGVLGIRHGRVRDQLLGVEGVLALGTVVAWPGDDPALELAGSEGTLGLVTAARFALHPAPGPTAVAVAGLQTVDAALELAAALESGSPGRLRALELMVEPGLELAARHLGLPLPVAAGSVAAVLVELEAPDPVAALADALAAAGHVDDVAIAEGGPAAARLWRLREGHAEAIAAEASATGRVIHKLDVGIPPARLGPFLGRVGRVVAAADRAATVAATVVVFGHLGPAADLHVNVLADDAGPAIDDAVLGLVVEAGGSIAAEHGVGVAKATWWRRSLAPVELDRELAKKRSADPRGLLNPGVRFGLPG